jgi:hypothetical protein
MITRLHTANGVVASPWPAVASVRELSLEYSKTQRRKMRQKQTAQEAKMGEDLEGGKREQGPKK